MRLTMVAEVTEGCSLTDGNLAPAVLKYPYQQAKENNTESSHEWHSLKKSKEPLRAS
jgi:hypothetical protein